MNTTLHKISHPSERETRFAVVSPDNKILGIISKFRNTRTETHPWKAFAGSGYACRFVESFYGKGGDRKAVAAVIATSAGSAGLQDFVAPDFSLYGKTICVPS